MYNAMVQRRHGRVARWLLAEELCTFPLRGMQLTLWQSHQDIDAVED